jgi:hypothetical protein
MVKVASHKWALCGEPTSGAVLRGLLFLRLWPGIRRRSPGTIRGNRPITRIGSADAKAGGSHELKSEASTSQHRGVG